MKSIETILFATDFSDISEYAFDYAASFATAYNAGLIIVHVVANQFDLRNFYVPYMSFDELDAQVVEGAKKGMVDFCNKWREQFPDMKTFVLTGIPHEEILKKSAEENASLIVMGTHGRHGYEHFIFGSTAERVVKMAPCPVLTVRHPPELTHG